MGCQSTEWKRAVQVAVMHPILEPCVVLGCERVAGRAQSQKLCPGKESHPLCVSLVWEQVVCPGTSSRL